MRMLESDEVIVGRKELRDYCFAVLLRFEEHKDVRLSAVGNHINKAERIISLFSNFGVKVKSRESKNIKDDLQAMVITISRGD